MASEKVIYDSFSKLWLLHYSCDLNLQSSQLTSNKQNHLGKLDLLNLCDLLNNPG